MKTFEELVETYDLAKKEVLKKLPNPKLYPKERIKISIFVPNSSNNDMILFEFYKNSENQWEM
ncbi:hypothetical protein [Lutibacter sp.]|uniref:hypothetical protein n=1 Tax=Lutibacter sp. TaxID=1925666 RepID=UPI0034A0286F